MKNILVSGCGGRVGTAIVTRIAASADCRVIAGIDIQAENVGARYDFPVYASIDEFDGKADVVIDCSHHTAAIPLLKYCTENRVPAVIATTGHNEEETDAIRAASAVIPVMYSRNMSLGINLLLELVKKAAATLGADFNIEIVEQHHNKKLDAPSGTALMLADAAKSVREDSEYVYDRHAVRRERGENEIGIHSVRGGTIVGEHEVIFAGQDEVVRISHSAYSRDVFATGAVRAALYLADVGRVGMYTMSDMIADGK